MKVVLLSGGLDSSTLLAYTLNQALNRDNVIALSFNYDQRHRRELESAAAIAKYYRVRHIVHQIDSHPFDRSALVDLDATIPSIPYSQIEGISPLYVPFRNGIFVSIGVGYCYSLGGGSVRLASHLGDSARAAYPDCSPEFVAAINSAAYIGTGGEVSVDAPFGAITKKRIAQYARELGVPIDLTWSCYAGGKEPCGVCPTCREREEALRL